MANDVAVRTDTPLATLPEIMNPQTGEIVTQDLYAGISQLALTNAERDRLSDPIPVEDLDILPTGEVYASQIRYRRILNEVFGPGGWGMRPMSEPKVMGQTIMRLYALYARGQFVAEAPGECDYHPSNSRMSYATALEAAKSNALTRCCKDLGIASECWDRRFTEEFKREQCVQSGGKWYRKDRAPGRATTAPRAEQERPPQQKAGTVLGEDGGSGAPLGPDALRARRLAVFKRVSEIAPTDPGGALKALTTRTKLSELTAEDVARIEDMNTEQLAAAIQDATNEPGEPPADDAREGE